MPITHSLYTGSYARLLRPGMPVRASNRKPGTNEWTEIEGIVRTTVKASAYRIKVTVEDRHTRQERTYSLDASHPVHLHKGYLAEHGITLGDPETRRAEFYAAAKGQVL